MTPYEVDLKLHDQYVRFFRLSSVDRSLPLSSKRRGGAAGRLSHRVALSPLGNEFLASLP